MSLMTALREIHMFTVCQLHASVAKIRFALKSQIAEDYPVSDMAFSSRSFTLSMPDHFFRYSKSRLST